MSNCSLPDRSARVSGGFAENTTYRDSLFRRLCFKIRFYSMYVSSRDSEGSCCGKSVVIDGRQALVVTQPRMTPQPERG